MPTRKKSQRFIFENGKPAAIILALDEYEKLLERAEDAEDLKTLRAMRKRPLRFRKIDDVLSDMKRV